MKKKRKFATTLLATALLSYGLIWYTKSYSEFYSEIWYNKENERMEHTWKKDTT